MKTIINFWNGLTGHEKFATIAMLVVIVAGVIMIASASDAAAIVGMLLFAIYAVTVIGVAINQWVTDRKNKEAERAARRERYYKL